MSNLNPYPISEFRTNGLCLVDLSEYLLSDGVLHPVYDLNNIVKSFPPELPIGGFAAYGDARTFHAPQVRALRLLTIETAYTLSQMFEKKYVELIIDRILYRTPEKDPTKESLHRDTTPTEIYKNKKKTLNLARSNVDDVVTGGWINLSPQNQYFSCWPGTQNDPAALKQEPGFSKIVDPAIINRFKREKKRIVIPPYHMMVFNQLMIHEVLPTVRRKNEVKPTQLRLFIGFRFTDSEVSIIPDILSRLKSGDVIPLKSGQMPSMYPSLYKGTFVDKLLNLSLSLQHKLPSTYFEPIMERTSKKVVSNLLAGGETMIRPYVDDTWLEQRRNGEITNNKLKFKIPFPLLKIISPSLMEAFYLPYYHNPFSRKKVDFTGPSYNEAELFLYTPNVWNGETIFKLKNDLISSINEDFYRMYNLINEDSVRRYFNNGDKVRLLTKNFDIVEGTLVFYAYYISINDFKINYTSIMSLTHVESNFGLYNLFS